MIVERMLKAVDKLDTYSDSAVFKFEMGGTFNQGEQASSFAYVRPNKFRITSSMHEVVCDGKELTVYMNGMRRYTSERVGKDIEKQVARFFGFRGVSFGIGQLILAENPRETFAEQFEKIDLAGPEKIEGDPCLKLVGFMQSSVFGMADAEIPVSIWIRDIDHMIRRVELDLLEAMKHQTSNTTDMDLPFKEYRMIYDVRELASNEELEEETFRFEPPSGAKKVKKFYTTMFGAGETAVQFELSGKPAPDFELETADGGSVSLDDLTDGALLMVLLPRWSGSNYAGMEELGEIQKTYASKGVTVLLVHQGDSANKLVDYLSEKEIELKVAVDPGGELSSDYSKERFGGTIVAIAKGGTVQGRYSSFVTGELADVIRKDLDRLTAGETLASAKEMTDEEIEEASDQRSSRFSFGKTADPVNEDDLRESWAVRAGSSRNFTMQGGRSPGSSDDLWIRDRDTIKLVSPSGEVTTEIELPDPAKSQYSQEQFVVGRFGRQLGVLYMKTIPGEETQQGWRPPKEAILTASTVFGVVLWEMSFEPENYQLPQHMAMADLDGRGGDEAIFVHQGAIWIIDGASGEVLARKPVVGWAQWLTADDRDNNRVAELYLRTPEKLIRFDYRPSR